MSAFSQSTVLFNQSSDPVGLFSNSSTPIQSATPVTTVAAPLETAGYRFTHWTVNGVRHQDVTGRGLNPATFTIYENTDCVAHYLNATAETDADGVPDWFEIHFYNSLANGAETDTDSDGFTLKEEYYRDTHPNLVDSIQDGGVSRRRTQAFWLIMDTNYVLVRQMSLPAGIVDTTEVLPIGTLKTLPDVSSAQPGYKFGGWSVNGVRLADLTGRSYGGLSLIVSTQTEAVAYFYPESEDTDVDSVPDWFEWQFYGTLNNPADADTEGDDFTLRDEFWRDMHPNLVDTIQDGGISRRRSEAFPIDLTGFASFRVESVPAGILSQTTYAPTGTVVQTPTAPESTSGYTFGQWLVNGQRHADVLGLALNPVTIQLSSNTLATVYYYPSTQDSDADGVPDWFEWRYYGSIGGSPQSDSDADGFTLQDEWWRGTHPNLVDTVQDGGVSRRRSEPLFINLQPFERLKYGLVDGILTEMFSEWPNLPPTGWDFGGSISPCLCDWDGDGDLDLFLLSSNVFRAFENIGTPHNPNWSERSSQFASWLPLLNTITKPAISGGDWNGDGKADLAIGGSTDTITLLASPGHFLAGQPTPGAALSLLVGSPVALPALGGFLTTNRADLLVLIADGTVRRYTNSGTATPFAGYQENVLGEAVPNAQSICGAKVNSDTLLDVLVTDNDGRIWEFFGQSGGGFVLMSKVWAGSGNGFGPGLTVTGGDLDGDGDTDAMAGTSLGALVSLRDPRLGPPTGLKAAPGADSVELTWDADRSPRIKGYNVYRSNTLDQAFARLNPAGLVPLPWYMDTRLTVGITYFYNVRAVTMTYLPGNSVPIVVEGPPSDTVSATIGTVVLQMATRYGKPGGPLIVPVYISNTRAMSANFEVRIAYDNSLLTPVTVHRTHVTGNVTMTDNGSSNTGLWVVQGAGGSVATGAKTLFLLEFQVVGTAVIGQSSPLTVAFARLEDVHGQPLGVANRNGLAKARNEYMWGDVNGDGAPTAADVDRLKVLMKRGVIPTADEISAGDLTGDDELDADDLVLLMRYLDGKPLGR